MLSASVNCSAFE